LDPKGVTGAKAQALSDAEPEAGQQLTVVDEVHPTTVNGQSLVKMNG